MSGSTHFPSDYEKIPINDHDNYDDDDDHHHDEQHSLKTDHPHRQSLLSRTGKEFSSHGQEGECVDDVKVDERNDGIEMIPSVKSDDYGPNGESSYPRNYQMNEYDDHGEQEEEEEEEDFARYSAVFSPTKDDRRGSLKGREQKQGYHKANSSSWKCDASYSCEQNNYGWMKSSPVRRLIHKIHDARMESRRKRMERLLALPDGASIQTHKERCFLCCNTWCDLLDKGIFFILFLVLLYITILVKLGEEHVFVKKVMLGIGIPFFIFRISWRPLRWLVLEQRCDRKRLMMTNGIEVVRSNVSTDHLGESSAIQII